MKTVRLSLPNDYSHWLELAKEVEPLFGPMTDDPNFCDALRQAISDGNAFCLTEGENSGRSELFLGGIVISKEANEILWLAVAQHTRGQKGGSVLLTEAMKHFDPARPVAVTTFDKTIEAGTPARRLYESFGFRDSIGAGMNPAGIPTVTMILDMNKANHCQPPASSGDDFAGLKILENHMTFRINTDEISLEDLQRRIETTDLVPSRVSLLNGLNNNINKLKKLGVSNLTDLRNSIKTPKKIVSFSRITDIDETYLILLRREIESYFPKPIPLKSFDWLPQNEITKLCVEGITNTAIFFEYFKDKNKEDGLRTGLRMDKDVFYQISCLSDLTRMQWTSPLAARLYFDAGYHTAFSISAADPEVLCNALIKTNEGYRYFKGRIALRDVKRLIHSASYLATWKPLNGPA